MKIFSHGKFNWYGLIRIFKHGAHISIKPTLVCNLGCGYCGAEFPGSACWVDPGKELTPWKWMCLISAYNSEDKIRQVGITGGEPGLYKGLHLLVNALVEQGYLIYFYTNLISIAEFKKIKPSRRVKFKATLHEHVDRELFRKNLDWLSKRFFVINQEFSSTWVSGNDLDSMHRKMKYAEKQNRLEVDLFGPDGKLYKHDEKPDKEKYDAWRADRKGMVANPLREKIIQGRDPHHVRKS